MLTANLTRDALTSPQAIQRYYRWHSHVYDLTRWSFLFGRDRLLKSLPQWVQAPTSILEIGCGTGRNLKVLEQLYPRAELHGIDLCSSMLRHARRHCPRAKLTEAAFDPAGMQHDLILCSYSLSMFSGTINDNLHRIAQALKPGGHLAVVDFDSSPRAGFTKWMALNHVRMDGRILPGLCTQFLPVDASRHSAYGGLWQYFSFVGTRATTPTTRP
jgi:S-adenosylmethionine-diacylgycerolhomoserine-N-methlytransferase